MDAAAVALVLENHLGDRLLLGVRNRKRSVFHAEFGGQRGTHGGGLVADEHEEASEARGMWTRVAQDFLTIWQFRADMLKELQR